MSNTTFSDAYLSQDVPNRLTGTESFSFRQFSDSLMREIPCAEVMLLTTLPRGGLQVAQPPRMVERFLKGYVREWHAEDETSWRAISTGKAVRGKLGSRYTEEFLKSFGFHHSAAAAVSDPVLRGYVGVLQLLRTAEQGEFTSAELEKLSDAALQLSSSLAETRRGSSEGAAHTNWINSQPTDVRLFALNEQGEALIFKSSFDRLDESVRLQLVREVRRHVDSLDDQASTLDRLMVPDFNGDYWTLNAVTYRSYSALGAGPVVFFAILPTCPQWSRLRSGDLQADPEMSRLVSALHFMQTEYSRGPTLTEIARTVHLSPFHFHRRFTELFGLTPKHFLLECQIHDAKHQLLAGDKELAKIAADCGFAHQSHFTSRFKQATGLTPTRWRRMAMSQGR